MSFAAHDNPFATPAESVNGESKPSSVRQRDPRRTTDSGTATPTEKPSEGFKSYRLVGEYPRPWLLDKRNGRANRGNIIVWVLIVIAIALSGLVCYDGVRRVKNHDYCLVMDDNFHTFNTENWSHEIQTDGYGTGSFDWTTDSNKVTFTDSEGLHIVPHLTTEAMGFSEDQILDGAKVNLTKAGGDGTCTNGDYKKCSVASNKTTGVIIPPVVSARITTKGKKKIRYGKVEIVAKMPKGDWLWPALWMMPEDEVYGPWPRSGEIDIAEFRGNSYKYPGGNDIFTSTLHWGPSSKFDNYYRTIFGRQLRRSDFSSEYHTFGLEWSGDYLYTYIDSRLQTVLNVYFKDKTMWQRGELYKATENDTFFVDPWSSSGRKDTPFDQEFYLILNVAIGSKNGWFLDGVGGKPWVDASETAPLDFWKAKDRWLPSWGKGNDRGLTVKSVKMWQEGKCKH